jgi:hypothetical protein
MDPTYTFRSTETETEKPVNTNPSDLTELGTEINFGGQDGDNSSTRLSHDSLSSKLLQVTHMESRRSKEFAPNYESQFTVMNPGSLFLL